MSAPSTRVASGGANPTQQTTERWTALALVALVAAAALDITGRIAEVGPARFTLYQLLALALVLLAAWRLVRERAHGAQGALKTPLTVPLAAFLGTAALSLAFATELAPAVVQLLSLVSSVVLVLVVAVLLRSPRQGAFVAGGVLAVAAVFGVLAILGLAVVRPIVRKRFKPTRHTKTNVDALIGARKVLQRERPVVLAELQPCPELAELARNIDYAIFAYAREHVSRAVRFVRVDALEARGLVFKMLFLVPSERADEIRQAA